MVRVHPKSFEMLRIRGDNGWVMRRITRLLNRPPAFNSRKAEKPDEVFAGAFMKYCCKNLEDEAGYYVLKTEEDGTVTATCVNNRVLSGIKFCPFCGETLSWIDHIAKPTGDGWAVWSRGARGAYFHTEEEAENHVKMLQEG